MLLSMLLSTTSDACAKAKTPRHQDTKAESESWLADWSCIRAPQEFETPARASQTEQSKAKLLPMQDGLYLYQVCARTYQYVSAVCFALACSSKTIATTHSRTHSHTAVACHRYRGHSCSVQYSPARFDTVRSNAVQSCRVSPKMSVRPSMPPTLTRS